MAHLEDVNRALITCARQVFTLDIESQVADLRWRRPSAQLSKLPAILRIEYSDEGTLRGCCGKKCTFLVESEA